MAAVCAPPAVPSSVPSPSCGPVLVTAIVAKTIFAASACVSAAWLLAVSSVYLVRIHLEPRSTITADFFLIIYFLWLPLGL